MDMMPVAGPGAPQAEDPAALLAAADALRDRRDWAEAAQAYAAYLQHHASHWQIWVQYGHCMKECGDPTAALLLYREAERLEPADADLHLQLGHVLKLLDRPEDAFQEYARALTLDPGNAAARAELLAGEPPPAEPAAEPVAGPPSDPPLAAPAPLPAAALPACLTPVFDISDLLDYFGHSRTPTGIQRVQLNIVREALAGAAGSPAIAALFDPASGTWKPVPEALFTRLAALSATGGDPAEPAWLAAVAEVAALAREAPPLPLGPETALVAIGTSWWLPDFLHRVREAKARHGIRYIPLLYDCIPLVVPEHCDAGLVDQFATWFASVCLHADAILVISDNTREDVLRLQRRLLPGLELPVRVLPLDAAPLLPPGLGGGAPAPRRPRPFVLFVATIESRKNHLMVFQAWLTLIRRHGAEAVPDLVCVGKRGWLAEPALALHANSAALRERVFLLHGIPDAELDGLYRECRFTLFNSFYEGWGLPVTESLGHGKVPLVADNSSLPEAGGEGAVYFESQSEPSLVAALERLILAPGALAAQETRLREVVRLRRWADLAAELGAHVAESLAAPQPAPLARFRLRPGQAYETRLLPGPEPRLEMAIADAVREGPAWGRLKAWGVRTLQGRAVLRLPLEPGGTGPMRITLEMQGQPEGGRFGLRAGAAGAVDGPFRWVEAGDHERLFCVLEVPEAAGADLAVEIEVLQGTRLEDGRLAGPNLLGVMACRAGDLAARLDYLERRCLHRLVAP